MIKALFVLLAFSISHTLYAQSLKIHSFPFELTNEARYQVMVNGQAAPVLHIGINVYAVSFDFTGKVAITVKVEVSDLILENQYKWKAITEQPKRDSDYFKGQAVVRPLSKAIAVQTNKNNASFTLTQPGQYTLEAPGTSGFRDEVLLVFANAPETNAPKEGDPNVIYLKKGIHQERLNLESKQTLYLESGAVLIGAVNSWNADNVSIKGRGTIIYQEPLKYGMDNGPYNRENQHLLTTNNVKGLTVEGVTFIIRSQTWSVQLVKTADVLFDNLKLINVTIANINGDGIDWMDGARGKFVNCFIRSSDDNFAFLDSSSLKDFRPKDPLQVEHFGEVKDVSISNCVFWNTFGSILRLGWTSQSLTTSNITIKDCDVIHGKNLLVVGIPKRVAHSRHSDYLFQNLRFEEPAGLVSWGDPTAAFYRFRFKNITLGKRPGNEYGIIKDQPEIVFENITMQ